MFLAGIQAEFVLNPTEMLGVLVLYSTRMFHVLSRQ